MLNFLGDLNFLLQLFLLNKTDLGFTEFGGHIGESLRDFADFIGGINVHVVGHGFVAGRTNPVSQFLERADNTGHQNGNTAVADQ